MSYAEIPQEAGRRRTMTENRNQARREVTQDQRQTPLWLTLFVLKDYIEQQDYRRLVLARLRRESSDE